MVGRKEEIWMKSVKLKQWGEISLDRTKTDQIIEVLEIEYQSISELLWSHSEDIFFCFRN